MSVKAAEAPLLHWTIPVSIPSCYWCVPQDQQPRVLGAMQKNVSVHPLRTAWESVSAFHVGQNTAEHWIFSPVVKGTGSKLTSWRGTICSRLPGAEPPLSHSTFTERDSAPTLPCSTDPVWGSALPCQGGRDAPARLNSPEDKRFHQPIAHPVCYTSPS